VLITLGDPRGALLPETEGELPADVATAIRAEFESAKQERYSGPAHGFWRAALAAFGSLDGGTGHLDRVGFRRLCTQLFATFGGIGGLDNVLDSSADGGADRVDEFYDRAAAFGVRDGVVSYPEIVAVFLVEFKHSPLLSEWVGVAGSRMPSDAAAQRLAAPIDGGVDMTQHDAAAKMQAVQRGNAARKDVRAQQDAALRVQAVQRGNIVRKQMAEGEAPTAADRGAAAVAHMGAVDEDALRGYLGLSSTFYATATGEHEERQAAMQIQAVARGRLARQQKAVAVSTHAKTTLTMIRETFDRIDGEADGLINERELSESTIHQVLSTDARTFDVYEKWKCGRIIIKFEHFAQMFIDVKHEVRRARCVCQPHAGP
jgi:hypothetical protein